MLHVTVSAFTWFLYDYLQTRTSIFIHFMIRILCMQKQAPPPPLWSGWNWGNVVVIVVEDYTVLN